jgi:hypothetical protein
MRLPEVADALLKVAEDKRMPPDLRDRIIKLTGEMKRRSGPRRPVQSATVTPALMDEIREYHRVNRHMTQSAIARHFNVNPGRVSEAINGKRD